MSTIQYYQTAYEEITLNRQNPQAKVTLYVKFADAISFGTLAIGGYQFVSGAFIYVFPAFYNRLPGLTCNDVSITPLGDYDKGNLDWNTAKVVMTFGIPDQPENDFAADWSTETSGEELTIDQTQLTNQSTGKKFTSNDPTITYIIPKIDKSATFQNVATLDDSGWSPYVGKVNSAIFNGWAPETVMFMGGQSARNITADGNTAYSISYKFSIRPNGWNKHFVAGSGWVDISPKPYTAVDLTAVLP